MVKPCQICGDQGVPEAIITCCQCKSSREHLYCMSVVTIEVPTFWHCDECKETKLVSPKRTRLVQDYDQNLNMVNQVSNAGAVAVADNASAGNDAGLEAGKPNLTSALVFSDTSNLFIPTLNSYWKGSFNLPNGHENMNDVFMAHPPSRVHMKVYEAMMNMPETINFELAPQELYMEIFSGSLPNKDDIGLYFFPTLKQRSENSMALNVFLWSKNLLMKSVVGGVELLVFSSKLLEPCSQEFEGNCFLWGVFHCPKDSKKVADAPLLLHVKCEPFDDSKKVVEAPLFLEVKCEPFDVPPGFKKI